MRTQISETTLDVLTAVDNANGPVGITHLDKMLVNMKRNNILSTLRNCLVRNMVSRTKDVHFKYMLTAKGHCLVNNRHVIKEDTIVSKIDVLRFFYANTTNRRSNGQV